MDDCNFITKFDIIYKAVKHKILHLGVNDTLYDQLIDIVTGIWADEFYERGYDAIYEHLRYSACRPIQEWSLIELLDQFVDETQDYWEDEYQQTTNTMCSAHRRFNEVIDQTFTPIELTALAVKLHQQGIEV